MSIHRTLRVVSFPGTRRIRAHPNQIQASARKRKRRVEKRRKLGEEARMLNINPLTLANRRFMECELRIEQQRREAERRTRKAMEEFQRTGWRHSYW